MQNKGYVMSEIQMNVVNSSDLKLLVNLCSSIISSKALSVGDSPFDYEKVIVMNKGMQTYLQQEIAKINGICSGIEFVQLWSFIWSLHKTVNRADSTNRFSHEHMTWSIFSLLDEIMTKDEPIYQPLKDYMNVDSSPDGKEKSYQLCGAIADAFDQYQMYRPDWILEWNTFDDSVFDDITIDNGRYTVKEDSRIAKWVKKASGENKNARAVLEANLWQIKLWTSLKNNLAATENTTNLWDRATVISELIEKFDRAAEDPSLKKDMELPKRVFIFGVTALPTQVIHLFSALGRLVPVFFMNLNPCAEFWGDLGSDYSTWKREKKQILKYLKANALSEKYHLETTPYQPYRFAENQNEDDYCSSYLSRFDENGELIEGNPLLISLGQQGRDTLNEILNLEDRVDITQSFCSFGSDQQNTLTVLESLKDRLLKLEKQPSLKIKDDDRSFQIRSCHTRLREVEVLRDELLHTFRRHGSLYGGRLSPKDILVMVPNIEEYAPLIESVFGAVDRNDPNFIEYSICDKTIRASSEIADAIIKLLSIGTRPITATLIVDLLSVNAIARKFDIGPDDLNVITDWLKGASVHWGLDDDNVKEMIGTGDDLELPWTLQSGIDRLIKGFMHGTDTTQCAYTDFDTSDLEVLGKFCDFFEKIKLIRDTFTPNLNITTLEWTAKLEKLLIDSFFAKDSQTDAECSSIREILCEMNEAVNNLKNDQKEQQPIDTGFSSNLKIRLPVFRAKLIHAFGNNRDSSRYLRGGVIFCSLMPMRAIPFEYICILGLNDDSFPRKDTSPSFNLLGSKYLSRKNDRSVAVDDRYIFLESILSAQRGLYLSYIGQSAVDKSEKNASSVLTELEEYLCDSFYVNEGADEDQNRKDVKKRLFRQEYLNSYNKVNYRVNADRKSDPLYAGPSFNTGSFWIKNGDEKIVGSKYEPEVYHPLGYECGITDKEALTESTNTPESVSVSIEDIVNVLSAPCRKYVKDVLNISLNLKYESNLEDSEPFSLSPFELSKIMSRFIFSEPFDEEEIVQDCEREKALGTMPVSVFYDKSRNEIVSLLTQAHSQIVPFLQKDIHKNDRYEKTFDVDGVTVNFVGNYQETSNVISSLVQKPEKKFRYLLTAVLTMLSYRYTTLQQPVDILVLYKDGGTDEVTQKKVFDSIEDPDDFIKRLLSVYLRLLRIPVPATEAMYTKAIKPRSPDLFDEYKDSCSISDLVDEDDYAKYLFASDRKLGDEGLLSKRQLEILDELYSLCRKLYEVISGKAK